MFEVYYIYAFFNNMMNNVFQYYLLDIVRGGGGQTQITHKLFFRCIFVRF